MHYDDIKKINNVIEHRPKLADALYIITEKIHGANFSIYLENGEIKYASRNEMTVDFFGCQAVLGQDKFQNFFKALMEDYPNQEIVVVGELFGDRIQKGVNYGKEKNFRIFDIRIDEEYLSPFALLLLLGKYKVRDLYVPILATIRGLVNALAFNVNINSKILSSYEENIMEGGVIRPYYGNKVIGQENSPFRIKKKNEAFFEKSRGPRKPKEPKVYTEVIMALRLDFDKYLNMNRVESAVSKFGEFSMRDFGKLIPIVLNDAIKDFTEDFPKLMDLSKEERRFVTGYGGGVIAKLLREYLKN
ncbi:MAG: RNA ligase [Candidatus Izimaplasma bacterium HR2]|nr:MAG: RNA ligase [Candidatus Izimaplasma bacterium HR2]